MSLDQLISESLDKFVKESAFASDGGVVTDLDGTALHEVAGKIYIPKPVEFGLKALHDLGRPFALNTLRFPLSVLRTFGRDWYGISNSPIPTVTLNGSLIGYVTRTAEDEMVFEEIDAFPLKPVEIDGALNIVEQLIVEGVGNILIFYYPRDWRMGEIIWTPVAERVLAVKEKYLSASSVTAVELPKLREQMQGEDICMIFLLVELGGEQLMAYQHTQRNDFFTTGNVDKLSGARYIAERIGFRLESSVGAGDTDLDRFLSGVGLAAVVGHRKLPFRGLIDTVHLSDSFELGDVLFRLAELAKEARS
jgi:hydroxymethylpyrimidine pyrophosphatase-like HAD family hydrolase